MRASRVAGLLGLALVLALVLATAPQAGAQKAEPLGDDAIAHAVERAMERSLPEHANDFEVRVRDGIVTLRGVTDTVFARRRGVELAKTVRGVRGVLARVDVAAEDVANDVLAKRVADAFVYDLATDGRNLRVSARQGVVTVHGVVDSKVERDRVAAVASDIRGVKGVVNKVTLDPRVKRSELEIYADVRCRLSCSAWVDAGRIEIEVDGATVRLSGKVPSLVQATRAATLAWVTGVRSVDTSALVAAPGDGGWARRDRGEQPGDDEILEALELAIAQDSRLGPFDGVVQVGDGVVTLRGKVPSLATKRAVAAAARNMIGVWRVRNQLRVPRAPEVSDAERARQIRHALRRNGTLRGVDIEVRVDGSRCYLEGRVDTPFQATHAEAIAARADGVARVVNRLNHVPPRVRMDDFEIRSEVEEALRWDVRLAGADISVTVRRGVATLRGKARTWQQRLLASAIARELGAVAGVVNELEVTAGSGPRGPSNEPR